jgi:energy-coupling factor transport system permease protein
LQAHFPEVRRSRGIDLAFKLRNVKNLIALLMPLLFQSFFLADDLAVAMESRGFGRKDRSFRKIYCFTPKDWIFTLLCLAALTVFLYLERGSGFG